MIQYVYFVSKKIHAEHNRKRSGPYESYNSSEDGLNPKIYRQANPSQLVLCLSASRDVLSFNMTKIPNSNFLWLII